MYYELSINPRVSETDMLGHINNVSIAAWFEEGRVNLLRELQEESSAFPPFILARIEIDYRAQMHFGHQIQLKTWIARIGTTSIRFAQELWQREHCCASGSSVMVHLEQASQRPTKLPLELVKQLEFYLVPDHSNVS